MTTPSTTIRLSAAALLIPLQVASGIAQTRPASRIDADRLMASVRTLADPKWEGRASGSPGNLAARGWIVERFKELGLQPVAGEYVHPFTYTRKTPAGVQSGGGHG